MQRQVVILSAIVVTIVAGILGSCFYKGLANFRKNDNYVSVKGIAETNVKADMAIWTISFKEADNDLGKADQKINADKNTVMKFLTSNGISNSEIEVLQTSIVDQMANEYNSNSNADQVRYIASMDIQVKSANVDIVKAVSSKSAELISQGVILQRDYSANPRYIYTKLDSIRPEMLDQGVESAKVVAQQFAKKSGTCLGRIKKANQGLFQILSADDPSYDEAKSILKKVRVVVSIDYYLGCC